MTYKMFCVNSSACLWNRVLPTAGSQLYSVILSEVPYISPVYHIPTYVSDHKWVFLAYAVHPYRDVAPVWHQ